MNIYIHTYIYIYIYIIFNGTKNQCIQLQLQPNEPSAGQQAALQDRPVPNQRALRRSAPETPCQKLSRLGQEAEELGPGTNKREANSELKVTIIQ